MTNRQRDLERARRFHARKAFEASLAKLKDTGALPELEELSVVRDRSRSPSRMDLPEPTVERNMTRDTREAADEDLGMRILVDEIPPVVAGEQKISKAAKRKYRQREKLQSLARRSDAADGQNEGHHDGNEVVDIEGADGQNGVVDDGGLRWDQAADMRRKFVSLEIQSKTQ